MPVLSLIAFSFLALCLAAGLTIALLPLGILRGAGWFPGSSEVSLWMLLLTSGVFGLLLLGLRSEDRVRRWLTAAVGSTLLAVGVLLGIEILVIRVHPVVPDSSGRISLWLLFVLCSILGLSAVYAAERTKRLERQAEEERLLELERQAQAACAEERLRGTLRFGRRGVRR